MATSKKTPVQQLSELTTESLDLAESFSYIPETVRLAREAAIKADAPVPSHGACAALTFLARAVGARTVVEIGTGPGVTGLALFAGMLPNGVLTSIDDDTDWQLDARQAYIAAGVASHRFRLITGIALDVLPKLRDAAYDIVFINGDKLEYVEYVTQAARLLRPGGVVILNDALWHNLVADQDSDDDEAYIIREALQVVQEDDDFAPIIIPLGDGLLAAAKR
ncbi:MAG: class I SAM-dependent methyltransferase [Propionibacteriaceae bacterium]|nr:class I SAM-dependent methyltransferase [Propionibacteriaceae bacterium]